MIELLKWIPSVLGLFLAGFNAAIFIVIKFNDLKHLEESVKDLTKTLTATNEKLIGTSERISKIEGKCSANHG